MTAFTAPACAGIARADRRRVLDLQKTQPFAGRRFFVQIAALKYLRRVCCARGILRLSLIYGGNGRKRGRMYTSVRINPEKAEKGRRKRWEEDIYKKCRESLTFITLVLCCIISKAVCARAIAFPQVSTTKMENEMKCHIKSICSRGCLIALAYFFAAIRAGGRH